MDREVLVKQMRKVERRLRQEVGPVAPLMLVPFDPISDEDWNVIVSARGYNRHSFAEGIRWFIDLLRRTLGRNMWPHVKRVTVLRTDDPFVEGMTAEFRTKRDVTLSYPARRSPTRSSGTRRVARGGSRSSRGSRALAGEREERPVLPRIPRASPCARDEPFVD